MKEKILAVAVLAALFIFPTVYAVEKARNQKESWVGKKVTERLIDRTVNSDYTVTTIVLNDKAKMEWPPVFGGIFSSKLLEKHNNSKVDFLMIISRAEGSTFTVAAEIPLACRVSSFKKFMAWVTNASQDKETGFAFKLFVVEGKLLKEKYDFTPRNTLFCKYENVKYMEDWGRHFSFPREGFNFVIGKNQETNEIYAYHVDKHGLMAVYF